MLTAINKQHEISNGEQARLADSQIVVVSRPTAPELRRVARELGLDHGNLTDAVDTNEVPRLEYRGDYDYLYVRVPRENKKTHTLSTQPLLVAYNTSRIILISPELLAPILNGQNNFHQLELGNTMTDIVISCLSRVMDSYDYHIKQQTELISHVVDKLQRHKLQNEDFVNFVSIEDQINSFLAALMPLNPLFTRLMSTQNLPLNAAQKDSLYDVILESDQMINTCNANSKRLGSIRDAFVTMSNNSLNATMKTLTVATLLVAVPNVIFGMYGMNIHLPLQWHDYGFIFVLSLAGALIILVALWAKRRKLF